MQEAREALARRGLEVAGTRLAAAEFEIRGEVETLYAEAALAEGRLALACDQIALSREFEAVIQRAGCPFSGFQPAGLEQSAAMAHQGPAEEVAPEHFHPQPLGRVVAFVLRLMTA